MTEADPEDNFSKKEAAVRACSQTATPDDVADAVLLLTSEKSRWITGQFIDVSGGITGAV
jgi:NAD(P)-dependent dehydrogenase (short-subunit alcohol dehydrogenase family)